jgi:hypothetical protein
METSVAMFWGGWRKTSGAYVQSSDATIPGACTMATRHSLCGSSWLQRKRVIPGCNMAGLIPTRPSSGRLPPGRVTTMLLNIVPLLFRCARDGNKVRNHETGR